METFPVLCFTFLSEVVAEVSERLLCLEEFEALAMRAGFLGLVDSSSPAHIGFGLSAGIGAAHEDTSAAAANKTNTSRGKRGRDGEAEHAPAAGAPRTSEDEHTE